jgi:hypothetical protein
LRSINAARSGEEQRLAVLALDAYDRQVVARQRSDRELDLTNRVVQDRMVAVATHERSTIQTDWLGDVTASAGPDAEQKVMAEAALWYRGTPEMVRQDAEEFTIQAQGKARRVASAYGESAEALERSFLNYVAFLSRQAASGLDQVQQLVDSHEDPKRTPLPTEVFDTFQPEVDPVNAGVTGTETSERAPLMQEIMQGDAYGEGPEKPGGHSTSFDGSGGYSEVPADAADAHRTAAVNQLLTLDDYRLQFAAEARRADPKEGSSHEGRIDHETSSDGPRIPSLPGAPSDSKAREYQDEFEENTKRLRDEFEENERSRKQGASGLDEVQQVVNPHEDPAPTPMPTDVAFPWVDGQDEYEQDHPGQKAAVARHRLVASILSKEPASVTRAELREVLSFAKDVRGGEYASTMAAKLASADTGPSTWHQAVYHLGVADPEVARTAVKKTADQWTAPHEVPGGQVANSPATTPESSKGTYADGYAEGGEDARSGEAPTFADASSHAPEFVQGHTKGYQDAKQTVEKGLPKDEPASMGGQAAQTPGADATSNPYADPGGRSYARKISSLVSTTAARQDADFLKGMRYAQKWRPGRPLVTQGSAEFEGGLYAGISDNADNQYAWVAEHQRLARRDQRFADRISRHAEYSETVATDLRAMVVGPYLRLEAATSTDLDTTAPNTSPSPVGDTPINGPGKVPPLAGQEDPAAAGGPAPYNSAPPYGKPVVPQGEMAAGTGSNTTINTTIGGPMDQAAEERRRMRPTTLAFRHRVQASLVQDRQERVNASSRP